MQRIIPRRSDQHSPEGLSSDFTACREEIKRICHTSGLLPSLQVLQAVSELTPQKVDLCEPGLKRRFAKVGVESLKRCISMLLQFFGKSGQALAAEGQVLRFTGLKELPLLVKYRLKILGILGHVPLCPPSVAENEEVLNLCRP